MKTIVNNFQIILQAVLFSAMGIITMLLNRWYGTDGHEWLIAAISLALFSILNFIIGYKVINYKQYISVSFLIWTILFFDLLLDALLISKISLKTYDPILKNYIIAFSFHILINLVSLTTKVKRK